MNSSSQASEIVIPGSLILGRYVVLDRIASGGMAEVYLARELIQNRPGDLVVLKRIRPHLGTDETFIKMFINEARIAAQMKHPNVVQVFDIGQDNGAWALALEYLDGRDMLNMGRQCRDLKMPIPFKMTAMVMSQACRGLGYAHGLTDANGQSLNLVHRDMSPENIMVTFDGNVKVLDFGIAKAKDNAYKTQTGQIKGKLGYVSPEAITGKPLDGRTDIFAIGAGIYLFICGQAAFPGKSPIEVFEKTLKRPKSPGVINKEAPKELVDICMTCLETKPSKRFQTADQVADALDDFLSRHASQTGPEVLGAFMNRIFPADTDPMRLRIASLLNSESMLIEAHLSGMIGDETRVAIPSFTPMAARPNEFDDITEMDGPSKSSEPYGNILDRDDLAEHTARMQSTKKYDFGEPTDRVDRMSKRAIDTVRISDDDTPNLAVKFGLGYAIGFLVVLGWLLFFS